MTRSNLINKKLIVYGGWRAMDAQAPGREIRAASQAKRRDPRGEYVARWGSR